MTGEKVALVTGASSGIGRATAALLAGQGSESSARCEIQMGRMGD